jgi:uncharacterized protein (UPF0335 family)
MGKRAIISVSLVPEAKEEENAVIRDQIMKESFIPFCAEIEKVTIEEAEDSYKKLRGHGFSKKVARNIVRLYEG